MPEFFDDASISGLAFVVEIEQNLDLNFEVKLSPITSPKDKGLYRPVRVS
jgi:hypothetical protein